MTECRQCGAKSNNAFLCGRCTDKLRDILAAMPWWLDRLTETAIGQTRMSDNAGRKSAARRDLDGDAELAACIEMLPAREEDLEKARRMREKAALAHALATGGINAKASELLATIADSLGYWTRVLCEQRGADVPTLPAGPAKGASLAAWLAINSAAIALSEDAADIAGDIAGHMDDIIKTINRPQRWWALGECPTQIDDREECGTELRAPAETEEVQCRKCGTRHNVHRLLLARKADAEKNLMTRRQLIRYNRELPAEFQVAPRTLRHWLQTGRLCACSGDDDDDDPLYSWVDVQMLVLAKPQILPTGARRRTV